MFIGGLIACGLGILLFLMCRLRVPHPVAPQLVAFVLVAGGGYLAFTNKPDAAWLQKLFAKTESTPEPSLMESREEVMALENKVAAETARLQAAYTKLNSTLAQLDKNNAAAVTAYNAQAKEYQTQKAALDALRGDLLRRQAALQTQVDQAVPAKQTTPVVTASTPGEAAAPPGQIILFLKKGNPAVTMARTYLSGRRLTYREVDVDASEENRKEWNKYGTTIPTIVIDGQVVNGYVRSELDRLIPAQADPIDAF